MTNSARFWDKIAKKYARRPVSDEAAYQLKLAKTREYLTLESEMFEFGCGTGSTALAHAPYVKHILATDISGNMIEIARSKAADAGITNVTFEQARIDAIPPAEGRYHMVMAHSILHLLEDKDAAIAKAWHMLKPGGAFVSSTACLSDGMGWFRYIASIGRWLGLIPYVAFFSQRDLKRALTDAGFRIDHEWQPGKNKALFIIAVKDA